MTMWVDEKTKSTPKVKITNALNRAAMIVDAERLQPGHCDYLSRKDMVAVAATIIDDLADALELIEEAAR